MKASHYLFARETSSVSIRLMLELFLISIELNFTLYLYILKRNKVNMHRARCVFFRIDSKLLIENYIRVVD